MAFIIASIHSALHDLELLENISFPGYEFGILQLMHKLRNLRTFLLCARKLGDDVLLRSDDNKEDGSLGSLLVHGLRNLRTFLPRLRIQCCTSVQHVRSDDSNHKDGSLGSLLVRIEEAVCKNARKIHSLCLNLEEERPFVLAEIYDFLDDIEFFEKEIDEWYITLADYVRQSNSASIGEVMEIMDSRLESLVDFIGACRVLEEHKVVEPTEALVEKIKFLRNLIRFATLQNVEQQKLKKLLTHIEAVSVNAAHLYYMCYFKRLESEVCKEMQLQITVLLQKIKPIDPQVCETYIQVLTSSTLQREINALTLEIDNDPILIMQDFNDSLVCNLWEILQLNTCHEISLKDQLRALYEDLRFLRTILKEQPNKFDEKIRDLTGDVICDAGVLVFSLSQNDVEIDTRLRDLLQKIKIIRAKVEEQVPEKSTYNFPRTNELGFLDFLIENLELTSCKIDSNDRVQTIQKELVFLRSFLGETVELHNEHEELQALWNQVIEVAYRVEFLIDCLAVGDAPNSLSTSFDSITTYISNIKANALKIFHGKRPDITVKKVTRTSSHVPSLSSAPVTGEVVGLEGEKTTIINRLTRGSMQLRIVAIVGMAGLGKTTLATKVYNDPSIMHYFHVRAWCSVSQAFNKKRVLLEILNHIITELPGEYFYKTEQDLAEELRRCLKQRRYLIFLDDVWDIDTWNSLQETLPDDLKGSRIMLTSRLHNDAPKAMLDEKPHLLRPLTDIESRELLQKKLFPGKCPPVLDEMGMQIAEKCKGLPLTIIVVAGLLATMEQESWKEVLENLSSGIISSEKQCMNSLELSYKHLPDYLKPCLLYFGAFPENREVSLKELIWLWIAEGFVRETESKSLEVVATDYMKELISRSLVMVAKERSIGGVKACRIHDLLYDLCIAKAKEENFFRLLKGHDELFAFSETCTCYLRRLCIQSESKDFKDSKLICPHVCSLLFFTQGGSYWSSISFIIHTFKFLKVLDLKEYDLGFVFPSEIELLLLKYLAVQGKRMTVIPSSIGKLSNLKTFIVDTLERTVSLPETLWNLQKLRHLYICNRYYVDGFRLPSEDLDNSCNLHELDSFYGALFSSCHSMEKQLKKFPNIRKLRCKLFPHWVDSENCNKIVRLDFMSGLESLDVSQYFVLFWKPVVFEFVFPWNLKKLTLSGFHVPWSKIFSIGKLPNLEVLKLLYKCFSGETWEMEEGEFPKLRFLKLAFLDVVRWTASDDQFPCLQRLVLEKCYLEEMPSCLECTSTLELIEVSNCSVSTARLVEKIQEEQINMGNQDIKISLSRIQMHQANFLKNLDSGA